MNNQNQGSLYDNDHISKVLLTTSFKQEAYNLCSFFSFESFKKKGQPIINQTLNKKFILIVTLNV